MKKIWEVLMILTSCLLLCQCGTFSGGDDDIENDGLERVGDDPNLVDDFGAGVPSDDYGRPSEVEIDDRLDAAVVIVNLNGEKRNLVIKLNAAAAPQTVLNFKRNVARNYYNGLAFHRVIPNYIVQTGDPLTRDSLSRENWGTGGPGYTIPLEAGQPHVRGAVAMARLSDALNPTRESSGSQFYICLRKLSKLDGDYTVFGNVTQGLDVLSDLSRVRTDENDVPNERIEIETVKLVSSKSRFVKQKRKEKKAPKTKSDAEKGGFEKFIERIW